MLCNLREVLAERPEISNVAYAYLENLMSKRLISMIVVTLLIIITSSCARQSANLISEDELNWLKKHADKLEVLFRYQAPPNAYHDDHGQSWVSLWIYCAKSKMS